MSLSKQDLLRLVMENFQADSSLTLDEAFQVIRNAVTPMEPRWHAALVEDRDGDLWVNKGGISIWRCPDSDEQFDWAELNGKYGPVEILFEGVKDQ